MVRVKRNNVERLVVEESAARLLAEGYELMEPVTKEVTSEKPVLRELNLTQLRTLAKESGVEGAASLTKDELLAVLKDVM